MLTINEQQLKDLESFINTIPTAYGLPLLQFFGKLAEEQKSKKEVIPTEDWINKLKKED